VTSKHSTRRGAPGGPSKDGPASKTQRGAATGVRRSGFSTRTWAFVVSGIVVILVAIGIVMVVAASPSGSSTAGGNGLDGATVQANGGHWTNVTPDKLASMLEHKDFILLNVKTPYIGEIVGTDLYVPYVDLAARAAELPTDKTAKIVVYCRSGSESAIAAQTLIDLGYSNIDNLDGGMNAWSASGRALVQVNRS
jgi:phage shock protein E